MPNGMPLFRAGRSLLMPYVPGTDEFSERSARNNAKIPSDLKSLLSTKVADNPMYDVGMTGMTVYHGSPYKFSKFLKSKIGSGEGAQAYGHGLYFAEDPKVAKSYMSVTPSADTPLRRSFMGRELELGTWEYKAASLLDSGGSLSKVRREVSEWISNAKPGEDVEGYKKVLETLNTASNKSDFKTLKNNSSLYHVDLPDSKIEKMLDWDAPLSEQPEGVRKALLSLVGDAHVDPFETPSLAVLKGGRHPRDPKWSPTGKDLLDDLADLRGLHRNTPEFSALLSDLGIPGIKYLDAGSRTGGKGTRNFVVFDENEVKILERK